MMTTTDVPACRRWPVMSALGIVRIFAWGSSGYLVAVISVPIATDTEGPLFVAGWIVVGSGMGALPLALFGTDRDAPIMGRLVRPSLIVQAGALAVGAILLTTIGADQTLTALACLALANVVLVIFLWCGVER